MKSQAQRDGQRKASAAAATARRYRAEQRRLRVERELLRDRLCTCPESPLHHRDCPYLAALELAA